MLGCLPSNSFYYADRWKYPQATIIATKMADDFVAYRQGIFRV
jgi:hypothetical protein